MAEARRETFPTPENITALLDEARMVLPGIQVLFRFQLISVFSDGFQRLTNGQRILHFLALPASIVSAIFVMTPAAYHRIAEKWQASPFFLRGSSYLVALAMGVLLISLTLEISVVASFIFETTGVAWIAAIGITCMGIGLWIVWPLAVKKPG